MLHFTEAMREKFVKFDYINKQKLKKTPPPFHDSKSYKLKKNIKEKLEKYSQITTQSTPAT